MRKHYELTLKGNHALEDEAARQASKHIYMPTANPNRNVYASERDRVVALHQRSLAPPPAAHSSVSASSVVAAAAAAAAYR